MGTLYDFKCMFGYFTTHGEPKVYCVKDKKWYDKVDMNPELCFNCPEREKKGGKCTPLR